jgi:predicted membrane protein
MNKYQDNLKNLDGECLDLVFNESKEKIKSVNCSMDILDKKSFALIITLIAILGLIASFAKEIDVIACGILAGGILISLTLLIWAIATKKTYGNSFKPKDILTQNKYYFEDSSRTKRLLINFYNDATEYNCKISSTRGNLINIAMGLSTISLILFIILN